MEINNDPRMTADDRMLQIQREIGKLDGQIIEVRREYKSLREDYNSVNLITICDAHDFNVGDNFKRSRQNMTMSISDFHKAFIIIERKFNYFIIPLFLLWCTLFFGTYNDKTGVHRPQQSYVNHIRETTLEYVKIFVNHVCYS